MSTTLPGGVLERARASDGIILGPISHLDYPPPDQGGVNISGVVRTQLDLYANVRPARTRPGLPAKGGDFDLVIGIKFLDLLALLTSRDYERSRFGDFTKLLTLV